MSEQEALTRIDAAIGEWEKLRRLDTKECVLLLGREERAAVKELASAMRLRATGRLPVDTAMWVLGLRVVPVDEASYLAIASEMVAENGD